MFDLKKYYDKSNQYSEDDIYACVKRLIAEGKLCVNLQNDFWLP